MKMNNAKNTFEIAKEKTIWDAERALYTLLSDHPFFISEVGVIRKKLGIPKGGFTDSQKAFDWEHKNNKNKTLLWTAAEDLVLRFKIKKSFRTEGKMFTYSHILSPKLTENLLPSLELSPTEKEEAVRSTGRHKIGARVIKTGNDIEKNKYHFKTNTLYLEITDSTTTRDVSALMKKITKQKKEALPFAMPKVQAAARMAWLLRQQGVSNSKVAAKINGQFGLRLNAQQVPLYAGRYEDALCQLKSLGK